ncbi:DUF2059 domain-containing protein [Microvirga sp. Mcv34]|uniref:DUF2059 domain-containing protein n=1 Tax=Microvirga sp. Mcv34 TaxID=2926016 RepID=UPI0021C82461|nr:DUF2059 domain-containing protein [Microvirga sp. Mcv34]
MKGYAVFKAVRPIIFLSLLALPLPATAQSVDEKIRYILEISDTERVMDVAFEGFRPTMIDQLKRISNKITPEIADHLVNVAAEEMKQIKPEFLAFAADLYKKEWSEEEIGALYDFYKSPVGARVGRKMATFTEVMLPQVQSFMAARYVPRVQSRIGQDERLRKALSP